MKNITDAAVQNDLNAVVSLAVAEENQLRADWLRKGKTVVLMPDWGHQQKDQANNLAAAMRSCGYDECFGVSTEPLKGMETHWQVTAEVEDLIDFNRKTRMFNFALVPQDGTFLVLCTVDDYFIFAGPGEFVRKACDGDLAAARKAFREYAHDASGAPEIRLQKIADLYGC